MVAAAFAAGTAHTLLAPASAAPPTGTDLDTILAVLGTSGLGVSLALIHIYVMQLKRLLQAFWVAGVMGGTYLLVTQDQVSLPAYVFDHPSSVWFIGPVFAALTGLTFKEGVCYGKAEAFALTLLIPALLLGHLTGWVPESVEEGLAVGVAALLVVFAGRKYTQPVKDDIGDGSVFAFQKLSPEGQAALVKKLREEGEVLR